MYYSASYVSIPSHRISPCTVLQFPDLRDCRTAFQEDRVQTRPERCPLPNADLMTSPVAPVSRASGDGAAVGRWLRGIAIAVLVGLPFVLLASSLLTWVRTAIDFPVADDWRPYLERYATSLDLSELFRPQNDTLYPVGKALDVLAVLAFGGNTVFYQALSMVVVLGGLLLLQWALLRAAFQNLLHTAIVFSLCSLMLVNRSYWGGPNLAYHQALPLLPILASLVLAVRSSGSTRWVPLLAFVFGLLAGLSYISGAFAALVAGACCYSSALSGDNQFDVAHS